jgi:hypothetical protein
MDRACQMLQSRCCCPVVAQLLAKWSVELSFTSVRLLPLDSYRCRVQLDSG